MAMAEFAWALLGSVWIAEVTAISIKVKLLKYFQKSSFIVDLAARASCTC